jgi:ComF family protein
LPWLGDHCQTCALPLLATGLTCGECLLEPPAFEQVVVPWLYGFPVDSLITRFKHNAKWPFGHLLADVLGEYLQHRFDEGLPRPDVLLPVPLAGKRLRQRGFNQSAMLARWLSQSLDLPCEETVLRRIKETDAQQDLDAKARKHNLRNAFNLMPDAQIKDRHLALVDDVLTTGATAQALARLLINAGAARVDVYCLARTPKPGS